MLAVKINSEPQTGFIEKLVSAIGDGMLTYATANWSSFLDEDGYCTKDFESVFNTVFDNAIGNNLGTEEYDRLYYAVWNHPSIVLLCAELPYIIKETAEDYMKYYRELRSEKYC